MTFDFDAYKRQCLLVAEAAKKFFTRQSIDVDTYLKELEEAPMVPPKAVAKIELEVLLKGSKFRPIDAYQF